MQVLPAPDRVTIITVPKQSRGACPLCGGFSGRVHSRYTRALADLPWQGRVAAVGRWSDLAGSWGHLAG